MKSLEQQLAECRERIEENNASIKSCKDNLVDIEKDPTLPNDLKPVFIQQWQDLLNEVRLVKSQNIDTYCEIYRKIGEGVMNHKCNAFPLGNLIVDIDGTVKPN